MSRLTRDGIAEPVSRDQILRRERVQGNIHFPCSTDHVQDWQPYPGDPYSAICDDRTLLPLILYEIFISFFFFFFNIFSLFPATKSALLHHYITTVYCTVD